MTTSAATPRPRAPHLGPDARRPEVIERAAREFAVHGFRGASLRAIAREAGVSKAVLYDCFPGGKTEMHAAVVARAQRRFRSYIGDVVAGVARGEGITVGLRGLISFLEQEPYAVPFLFVDGAAGDAGDRVADARAVAVSELLRAICRSKGSGSSDGCAL